MGATLTVTLESRPGDGDELVAVEVAGSRSGRSAGHRAPVRPRGGGGVRDRVRRDRAPASAPPALPRPRPAAGGRAGAPAARPGLRAGPAVGPYEQRCPSCSWSTDVAALADEAAARIERIALEAPAGGRARIALAGGATPRATYQHLAARCPPWGRVEFFFGDERCVPPDDPGSNYRMARQALLDRIPLRPEQVHRILGELPPEEAAAEAERELRAAVPGEPWPVLDLVVAGHGPGRPHGLALPRGAGAERDGAADGARAPAGASPAVARHA